MRLDYCKATFAASLWGELKCHCQPAGVWHTDVAAAVGILLRYFEQWELATQDDIQQLCAIKHRVDVLAEAAQAIIYFRQSLPLPRIWLMNLLFLCKVVD